jgi:tetratricopeptide (TPR) repeat protein
MKFRFSLAFFFLLSLALAGLASGSSGMSGMGAGWQEGVAKGPIIVRDPELEKQSQKSLEAAKFYFYRRKPEKKDADGWSRLNKSIEGRLIEIIDTNASFSRIDEVYFMLGEVYKRSGENEKAVENWRQALKESSNDKIKSDSQKRIDETKVAEKK